MGVLCRQRRDGWNGMSLQYSSMMDEVAARRSVFGLSFMSGPVRSAQLFLFVLQVVGKRDMTPHLQVTLW